MTWCEYISFKDLNASASESSFGLSIVQQAIAQLRWLIHSVIGHGEQRQMAQSRIDSGGFGSPDCDRSRRKDRCWSTD